MPNSSFQQTSFLGGEWSETAQGRMTDPNYQRAMATCSNGMPIEAAAWTRRPGFRYLGITRQGKEAKLFQFDFSTTQPYQVELTDGYLRLWAGLALVMADVATGYTILNISADSPAVVTIDNMPSTWATGDTAIFNINSLPCSAPLLCGRQFTMKAVSTSDGTFTLYDAVTGDAVDGSTLGWAPGVPLDTVSKVFELATPYTGTQWQDVRLVNNGTQVTLFHPSYAPRTLAADASGIFSLTTQAFSDGPYLDPNTTSTTLTPSGTSGSITVTASATTGINNDTGFQSTDVGRHIRFQSLPPAWASGTTYYRGAIVSGSDGNTYECIHKAPDNDPTTDDGTRWILLSVTPTWVWMKITAVSSTTVVTATVEGAASDLQQTAVVVGNTLASAAAQPVWQLGFFSDTTGYPTMGVYNQGRLWLANQIAANRLDASVSDDFFNFCPTALDGTVSDGNGITAVLNAQEVDAVFWLISTQGHIVMGTQGAEWMIAASSLNDPITPTSIQAFRMSTFGCANLEALNPWGRVLFMQRQGRKLLALRQAGEQGFDADNVSHLAMNFLTAGVAEMRWQQEPTLTTWLRMTDGSLAGCVYRTAAYSWSYGQSQSIGDENFAGFFSVSHAYGRMFDSISTGPSHDGLSDALYAVTNQPDDTKPDYNVRYVEYLTPLFDDAAEDWSAFFVDGGATPCCGRKFLVSNGDSFNGVRLYGLTYLNGLSTSVVIGGLDCGDYTVANGYVDVVFGTPATFTEAFFDALDNGTDYGEYGGTLSFVQAVSGEAPPHVANSIGTFCNSAETHGNFAFWDIDQKNNLLYGVNTEDTLFDSFNFATFAGVTVGGTILGGSAYTSVPFAVGNDGNLYQQISGSPHNFVAQCAPDGSTVTTAATTGVGGYAPDGRSFLPFPSGAYMAVVGLTSVSQTQALKVLKTDTMGWVLPTTDAPTIDEDWAELTTGPGNIVFVVGRLNDYSGGGSIGLYWLNTFGELVPTVKIAPSDVDATWSHFSEVTAPVYDATDGMIMMGFQTSDSVTTTTYFTKLNPFTGAFSWKTGLATSRIDEPSLPQRKTAIFGGQYGLYIGSTGLLLWDTATGTYTTTAFQSVFDQLGHSFWNETDSSLTINKCAAAWETQPTLLGTYSQANETSSVTSGRTSKLYFGFDGSDTTTSSQYGVAASIGLTYTSEGKLLRPDFGYDAGARAGPAFGKKRRLHWYAASLYRTRGISFGSDGNPTQPAALASDGGVPVAEPTLYSGIISTTLQSDYSWNGQISWEITRPYPAMIVALGGYIETQDK